MMLRRLTSVAFVALGLLSTKPGFALERVQDGFPEHAVLIQKVRALFLRNDFAAIEKLATEMRAGARFTDGSWQLATFYNAFAPSPAAPEAFWEEWFRRVERWENATPMSATPRFVKAEGWAVHASPAAPGTPKSAARFSESAAKGREILEAIPRAESYPEYFYSMMWVARHQKWPNAEFEKLFSAGIALAPDCELYYLHKATWVAEPRNSRGAVGNSWANFAAAAPALTSRSLGAGMYTRIVWSMLGKSIEGQAMDYARLNGMSAAEKSEMQKKANAKGTALEALLFSLIRGASKDGALKFYGVDWEKMKQGFLDLERLYPGSLWNKNAFCFYAFCANDRETTTRLMTELNDRFATDLWPSENYFNDVKEWTRTGRVP